MSEFVKLTIIAPAHQEVKLVEALLDGAAPVERFTTFRADGHGQSFERASVAERVSGRTTRVVLTTVLSAENARAAVALVEEALAVPQLEWWLEPVIAFGEHP